MYDMQVSLLDRVALIKLGVHLLYWIWQEPTIELWLSLFVEWILLVDLRVEAHLLIQIKVVVEVYLVSFNHFVWVWHNLLMRDEDQRILMRTSIAYNLLHLLWKSLLQFVYLHGLFVAGDVWGHMLVSIGLLNCWCPIYTASLVQMNLVKRTQGVRESLIWIWRYKAKWKVVGAFADAGGASSIWAIVKLAHGIIWLTWLASVSRGHVWILLLQAKSFYSKSAGFDRVWMLFRWCFVTSVSYHAALTNKVTRELTLKRVLFHQTQLVGAASKALIYATLEAGSPLICRTKPILRG